jgi:hypothetical protein
VLSATTRADPKVTIQAVLVQFPPELHVEGVYRDFSIVNAGFTGNTGMEVKGDLSSDGHDSEDPLPLTRSFWSLLITHALGWAREGWGAYVNANSALYINPVLGKEESQESMRELVEWGQRLKTSAGKLGGQGKEGVVVIQGEYDSWGHFFSIFADGNSAVRLSIRHLRERIVHFGTSIRRILASHLQ